MNAAPPVRAYLSLGSNLEPERHLRLALDALAAAFGPLRVSPVYRTPAQGFAGPDFLNLAVAVDTRLPPHALRDWLHALEVRLGRDRTAPRLSSHTLDADLVLYGEQVVDDGDGLRLPRADLTAAYVLKPLVDIAPDARDPRSGRTLSALWTEHPERDRPLSAVTPLI